uniref:F-box domain-containing protein n=1 Tax=Salix viminalis TaxID=40686 RepID=A0A6N2LYZ9_SALVM
MTELQNLSADAEYPVRYLPIFRAKTIRIRVYKLDEEWVSRFQLRSFLGVKMEIDDTSNHSWADLPKELLEMIGKRLDSRIDVYRFRASPRVPLKLPKPIRARAYLSQVTICRVELADDSDDSSSSSSMAWLTKVEESTNGDIQLLVPVSNRQLRSDSPGMVPKMLNLLDFRLVEITKACSLKLACGSSYGNNKAVWLPSSANRNTNEYCCDALAIFLEGKLGYRKFDEEEWKFLDETDSRYDDILCKHILGTVYWIDPSLNVIPYSPPSNGCGSQKSLVESDGDLYVVHRFFDGERRAWNDELYNLSFDVEYPAGWYLPICRAKTIRIRVYKLDEEWGTWVNISSLGDKVFVLGNECSFSVSAKEFSEGEDLPKELLEMISKSLDFRVDVLRFRSVCTSWRCSVSPPSFDQEIPPVFLKLPHPICADAVLMQTAICRMEYPRNYPSSSCSLSKSSLVKVGESKHGKLQLFHPLSNQLTRTCFLDLKFVQLSEACLLKWPSGISVFGINKVAMFPLSSSCNNNCELGILAIYHEGKLGYWKNGDKEWTLLDDRNFEYDDITVYRGISWIDPSLKVIQYSPPLHGCGGQKNLVESCGDLYVVDRYLDGERRTWRDYEDAMVEMTILFVFRN